MKFLYILTQLGTGFLSCLLALGFISATLPLFLTGEYLVINEKITKSLSQDAILIFTSSWAFFVITAFQISYHLPVLRGLEARRLDKPVSELAKKRLITGPFILGLSTLLGWEISTFLSNWRITVLLGEYGNKGFSEITLSLYVTWGLFIFAFCFFVADYFSRRYFLPYLMPEGGVGRFFRDNGFSILKKLILYWFSISLFPTLVIYIAYLNAKYNLNSTLRLTEIFFKDNLFFMIFLLLSLSFILSWILGKVFQTPLKTMAIAARKIQNRDYNVEVLVHSSDELGVLGDSFNEMALDLRDKEKMKSSFGKLVDPRIRDYILKNDLNLGGQLAYATILFCDLRGFTSLSERSSPEAVVSLLNEYFTLMTEEIEKNEGYVNKFIGDAILAVFGTPLLVENHADKALTCALAMEGAMQRLNLTRHLDQEKISMGIGIHTGNLLCGNIGSNHRLEFTVIGDTVNTASRVEGLSKSIGKSLLLTDVTFKALSPELQKYCQKLGSYPIRGKESEQILYFAVANPHLIP